MGGVVNHQRRGLNVPGFRQGVRVSSRSREHLQIRMKMKGGWLTL